MNSVTIDKLDIAIHNRYAYDQEKLDKSYITDARVIPPYCEIASLSTLYASKWEELFGVHIRNISWALFMPPPYYSRQPNKFFSSRILPDIFLEEEMGEEENFEESEENNRPFFAEREKEKKEKIKNLKELLLKTENKARLLHITFEKDKSALLNLLELIKMLNRLLTHIHTKKLQYQKG